MEITVVFADVTFNNERQKAEVTVEKQEKDTITFAVFRLRWNGYWF